MTDIKVIDRNGVPMVSSREVAAKFGKAHKNVLRVFDRLYQEMEVEEFQKLYALNFELIQHNGNVEEIFMTKDGFMLIAMGFTGSEALRWKVKFIQTFNSLVTTVETLNNEVARLQIENQHLSNRLAVISDLSSKKPKRKVMVAVPVYDNQLPGFEDYEPRWALKPAELVTDEPIKSISSLRHIVRTIEGLNAKADALRKKIGL